MKSLKLIAAGAFATVAFAGLASAQTKIYITGSTAFRGETTKAIFSLLGSPDPTDANPTLPSGSGYAYSSDATTPGGSKAVTFNGTANGVPVIIKTSWSGSAAGVQTVAQTGTPVLTVKFLPTTFDSTTSTTGDNSPANPTSGTNPNEAVVPDIAMVDNTQGSTLFNGTFGGRTYAALTATPVGIVPFVWVKSNPAGLTTAQKTTWNSITNMTSQLARGNWTNGSGILPAYLYTGNSADTTNVYATGRDPDSGTRINAFAESGVGINASIQQFQPGITSPSNGLYPASTINGVSVALGKGGESSGGTLAGNTRMGATNLTRIYVSYLGTSDASTLTANNGAILNYNGVPFTVANVENGLYTFWGTENLMYKSTLLSTKKTFADSLATAIDGITAIPLESMNVGRGSDGGTVTN